MKKHLHLFGAMLLCSLFAAPIAASADDVTGVTPPYTWDFEADNSIFSDFTVIDNDNNGYTWRLNASGYLLHITDESAASDDWLITPAIALESNMSYTVTVVGALYMDLGDNAKIEVCAGTQPTVDGMTTQVIQTTEISDASNNTTMSGTIECTEGGTYYIGVHAVSDGGLAFPVLYSIAIGEGTQMETTTPDGGDGGDEGDGEDGGDGDGGDTDGNTDGGDTEEGGDTDGDGGTDDGGEEDVTGAVTPAYTWDFEADNSIFSDFTVIDNDGDGNTWFINGSGYLLHMTGQAKTADDWLITPAIALEESKGYDVTVAVCLYMDFGANAKLEVYTGNEATVEGMTTQIVKKTEVADATYNTELKGTIEAATAGIYYIGVRAVSDAGYAAPVLYTISIDEGVDIEITGIDAVADRAANATVNAVAGSIVVDGAEGSSLGIYTADGKQVFRGVAAGNTAVGVAKGLYIVKVGEQTMKVIVK